MKHHAKNLKCEHLPCALGVGTIHPRLSWEIESGEKDLAQTAYRIQAWKGEGMEGEPLWDSGKIRSARQHEVTYWGPPLQIRSCYVWRVQVWLDESSESNWSEVASFETGFFGMPDWKASWIMYSGWGSQVLYSRQSVNFLRHEFELKDLANLKKARAYVAATAGACGNDTLRMNLYEFRLNGDKVGTDLYNPGQISEVKKRARFRTYDVISQLREGPNALGLIYASDKVSLELMLEYQDGRVEFVRSGIGWKRTPRSGPFIQLWNRDLWEYGGKGEVYDAREEMTGWDLPGFDDAAWGGIGGRAGSPWILAPQMQSVEIIEVIKPEKITKLPDDRYVVDFGRCMNGHVAIKATGPRGTKIEMSFAEALKPDGSTDPSSTYSWQGSISVMRNTYIKRGDESEHYAPHFANFGFRYVEIAGWHGELRPDDLCANAVCSAVGRESSFFCSDPRVAELQLLAERTYLSNLMSVPTDNCSRERMGWPGDATCGSTAQCAMFDMRHLYEGWLDQLVDEQNPDGWVPYVVPAAHTLGGTDLGWGTSYLSVAWDAFVAYGDQVFLSRYYETFRRWADFTRSLREDDGLSRGQNLFGDWLTRDEPDRDLFENFYGYHSADLVAKMAAALGDENDASIYQGHARQLRDTINARFLHDGGYGKNTQSENVHALAFGIVPEDLRKPIFTKVCEQLEADLSFRTGILGTQLLMRLLADEGRNDLAWKLAMSDKPWTWRYWVVHHGATTALEAWAEMPLRQNTMNKTWNQPALVGGLAEWLYRELAGIKPLTPGYETVCIAPFMPEGVDSASAKIPTPFGPVQSSWTRQGANYQVKTEIPIGVKAEVHLPGQAVRKIGSGRYSFSEEFQLL